MLRVGPPMLKRLAFVSIMSLALNTSASTQIPPGFTVFALLHPSWYVGMSILDRSDRERLIFRRFAYEGNLRNIFVLSCPKNSAKPVSVEIIPPSALKEALRKTARAKLQRAAIAIESEGGDKLTSEGEFDKISAFLDFRSEDDFHKFLELTGFSNQLSYVSIPQANIKFGLSSDDSLEKIFKTRFGEFFNTDDVEQLSWQDVFVRCSEVRER